MRRWWLVLILALAVSGCVGEDVAGGCCQAAPDKCASGPTVTQESCVEMFDGIWSEGKECSIDTGRCE